MNGTRKLLKYRTLSASAACLVLLCFAGCNPSSQSDQQVKQQAAQTTEQVKAGAQQAAADAKVAAANAERKVNDIAAGVSEGLHSNAAPGTGLVDINSASELRLVTLPGVTLTRARRIVSGRPYSATLDLVAKGVLSRTEYARISARIVAR